MPYKDPERRKLMHRQSYLRNRLRIAGLDISETNHTATKVRIYIRTIKESAKCADCGGSYPPYVFDFHHVSTDKLFDVTHMASRSRTLDEVKAEIAKCVLLCSNCHRTRHHLAQQLKDQALI